MTSCKCLREWTVCLGVRTVRRCGAKSNRFPPSGWQEALLDAVRRASFRHLWCFCPGNDYYRRPFFSFRNIGMNCRPGCGACCIAPSISSPIPGMPFGKPAGARCLHLSDSNLCGLFGHPARPAVCAAFKADRSVCGDDRDDAIRLLGWLEQATA